MVWGQLDALVCPADAASFPASICGYPVVTVPAGVVRGQPHGVGFIGTDKDEAYGESKIEQPTDQLVLSSLPSSLSDHGSASAKRSAL